jgi:hypothetical protein
MTIAPAFLRLFSKECVRTYVSGAERGMRNPTVVIVGPPAKALQVGPDELLSNKTRRN